jgi:hypothetical protein
MASGRENSEDAPLTKCELQRLQNIAQIKEKLNSLNIPTLTNPQPQAKNRIKVISYVNCFVGMSLLI